MLSWDILGTISHLQSPDKSLSFAWMLLQVVFEPGQAIFKVTHSDNSQEVCKLIQLRHVRKTLVGNFFIFSDAPYTVLSIIHQQAMLFLLEEEQFPRNSPNIDNHARF